MAVYDDDIATAKELIAEFGRDCYWQKPAPKSAAVPGYPTIGALPDPTLCKMVFFSAKDLDRGVMQFLEYMKSSEVPDSGQVGLLAGDISFTPELTDSIRLGAIDADPVSLMGIDLLAPDGTPILYFVTVAA